MSQALCKARIIGTGAFLPEKILNNADLEKLVDTNDEWISSRTGIKERRIASAEEFTSTMGAAAAAKALEAAKVNASDVDLVIVATMTPDYPSSSTAAIIQHHIGATHAAAFDIQAACTGFLYSLSIAKAFIESGIYHNILVVCSEKMSTVVDYTDRNTCVLFGDGAAAVVISHEGKGLTIDSICLGANGGLVDLLLIPAGGSRLPASAETVSEGKHYIKMQGRELFKQAVRLMTASAKECLDKASLKETEIEWLVPHQANERIINAIAKEFDIPNEKVFKTLHKFGNTSASSIPIALDELIKNHAVESKHHILMLGFGAGLTSGAILLTQM
ncbi:MAG: ketoacyl-ACP synthase III [Parachlamydiaceae bacterium]|nr:ketoacyl-ACP synthase III [Parachlamydiaceae bacterium]